MAATARAVDLTNVSEGGNFRPRRKPEGDYIGKVVKADDHKSKDPTKPMGWVLTIQIDGDARSTYAYYLSPEAKQAWKIRTVCVAAGLKAPTGRIKFDPNKLVNRAVGVALEDDEYEGRPKSTIADLMPVSEVGPRADEDAPEVDEVEDIDVDEEVEEEEIEEEEKEEPPPAPKRRRKPAPEPEPEEEEEEEEEPAPAPRKRRTTTPPTKAVAPARKRAAKPAPVDDEDDDLDDLDTDDLDDE